MLSNHMHHIVRNRPDVVETWSDEEVACRWKMAWPEWNGKDWIREPTDEEVRELLANPVKLALARRGLGSVSRASDNPILAMPFTQYREVVEWVVEQMGLEVQRPGPLPEWLVKYLQSRGADTEHWLTAVENFEAWFGHVVGSVERLREHLERTGNRWIRGMRYCRATFG